jgi:tyrosinase
MAPATPVERAAEQARAASCPNPAIVYEWRNLSDLHKQEFIAAIKCLLSKPPQSGIAAAKNRWDDLAAKHQKMNLEIDADGQWLPWHRYFM